MQSCHDSSQDACGLFMQALHERMQPLLLFFIDAASFIDAEDERWELLLASTSHNGITEVVSHVTWCALR